MINGFARAAFLALLPAVAVFGALGIPVLLVLTSIFCIRPSLLRQVVEKPPLFVLVLLVLTALIVGSTTWSSHDSKIQALQIAVMIPVGLMFAAASSAPDARGLTRAAAIAVFAVLGILLSIEAIQLMPLNRAAQPEAPDGELLRNVSRGATVFLALTWAATAALFAYREGWLTRFGLVAIVLGGFVSLQFGQFANTLAFGVGLVAFLAAQAAPRFMLWATSAGLAVWMLAAPWVTPLIGNIPGLADQIPRSWTERIRIWNYAAERIAEQPWIGHGLDAARSPPHTNDIPLHPHSASLHLWFDTGAVGAVLAALLLILGGRELVRLFGDNRFGAAAACATLASLGVVANVSFGLWAEWWMCTLFIAAALVGGMLPLKPRA